MPPTKRNEKTMSNLDQLNASETAAKFGFKFVDETDVPPAPRKKDTDPERWSALKVLLSSDARAYGQWAFVKEFDKAGSAQSMAAAINGDNNKNFPAREGWEARYEVTEKKTDDVTGKSKLFVRFNPPKSEEASDK